VQAVRLRALVFIAVGFVTLARIHLAVAESPQENPQGRLAIVVVPFSEIDRGNLQNRTKVGRAVIEKLQASGRFRVIAPAEETVQIDAIPQFERWRGLGAGWLVVGRVSPMRDDRLQVQFRLWDMTGGAQVLGEMYAPRAEDLDRVAAIIADAIAERVLNSAPKVP
jgi:Tol biopolymer transport system component